MKVSTYMFVGLWCKAVCSLVEQGSLWRHNRTLYKGQNKQMGKTKGHLSARSAAASWQGRPLPHLRFGYIALEYLINALQPKIFLLLHLNAYISF